MTLPAGAGPFPAAAVVHGSGPSKREEGQFLTSVLLRRGIAVLAYDKRGNGQSRGQYPGDLASPGTIDVLARDAQAAVGFLAAQREIDTRRIGLAGGSQAGWIIPLAASRAPQVSWAFIESGPVVTAGESDFFAGLTGQGQSPLTRPIEEIEDEVRRAGPSGFDPLPALRALRIPIYWAYGGLDRHQPTGLDVPVLQQLRAQTGADYTWRVFPNGDHGLFEVQTGLLSERRTSRGLSPDFVPEHRRLASRPRVGHVSRTQSPPKTKAVTTTEAAVLALLAIEGERSGYDLLELSKKAIGHVWTPARSRLYTVLPRLVELGLAKSRKVTQATRPDKTLYKITRAGRAALEEWLRDRRAERARSLPAQALRRRPHVDRRISSPRWSSSDAIASSSSRVLREIEPTNTRRGHDRYHWFLLRLGIEHADRDVRWADWVLSELEKEKLSPSSGTNPAPKCYLLVKRGARWHRQPYNRLRQC